MILLGKIFYFVNGAVDRFHVKFLLAGIEIAEGALAPVATLAKLHGDYGFRGKIL